MAPPSATDGPPALRLPAWAWAALALSLAFVYLRGIASDPLRWEEPRRALVATEMIHRADYVVPTLLGEPYLNKPPMQSWLIVLLAGGEARRVGPLSVRLPSVVAVAGIALLLWRLGLSSGSGPHPLPALVFLTFGILPQYGRPGEMDLVFTLWVSAALAAFERGRRQGSGACQWVLSQALVAAGILTKGIAPLFFHPPALLTAWRFRLRRQPVAFAAGLVVMLVLVAAWVVPYAPSGPVQALGERLSSEVAPRSTGGGAEIRLASLLQKPIHGTEVMDAKTMFRMATIEGAKALHLENEVGSIEIGKKADLVLIDLDSYSNSFSDSDETFYSDIVFSSTTDNVKSVMVDG